MFNNSNITITPTPDYSIGSGLYLNRRLKKDEFITFLNDYFSNNSIVIGGDLSLILSEFDTLNSHITPLLNMVEEDYSKFKSLINLNILSEFTIQYLLTFAKNKDKLKLSLMGNE